MFAERLRGSHSIAQSIYFHSSALFVIAENIKPRKWSVGQYWFQTAKHSSEWSTWLSGVCVWTFTEIVTLYIKANELSTLSTGTNCNH